MARFVRIVGGVAAVGATGPANPVLIGGIDSGTGFVSRLELTSAGFVPVTWNTGTALADAVSTSSFAPIPDFNGSPRGFHTTTHVWNGSSWDRMRGDTTGLQTIGPVADGVAPTGNPVLIAGQDGTLTQSVLTDTSGRFDITSTVSGGMPVDIDGSEDVGIVVDTLTGATGDDSPSTAPHLSNLTKTDFARVIVRQEIYDGTTYDRVREGNLLGSVLMDMSDDATRLLGVVSRVGTGGAITDGESPVVVQFLVDEAGADLVQGSGSLVYSESGNDWDRQRQSSADSLDGTGISAAGNMAYNGTTWDRSRGNSDIQGLASAVRTVSTNSSTFTNYNAKGLAVFLDVTVNPGSAETLDLIVQAQDAESSTWYDLTTDTPQAFGGGAGTRVHHVYPGIGAAAAGIDVASSILLPRTYRIRVEHSASGSWTYSVGVSVVL